jgi:hypothetical protein
LTPARRRSKHRRLDRSCESCVDLIESEEDIDVFARSRGSTAETGETVAEKSVRKHEEVAQQTKPSKTRCDVGKQRIVVEPDLMKARDDAGRTTGSPNESR